MEKYTINDLERDYPDNDACLERLKNQLFPNGIFCSECGKVTKHHKLVSRPSYSCDYCGHHVHPTVGTIFEKSTTPLRIWFHAIYLMSSTRCGISAKQIQRETGVTYKTAWRMFKQIRSLLAEDESRAGVVEADETYMGGKEKNKHATKRTIDCRGTKGKQPVVGVVERHGKITAKVVPNTSVPEIHKFIYRNVDTNSTIYSDEHSGYDGLAGYKHISVNHHSGEYVRGDAHTNTIEGFWSLLKRGITGVYHSVDEKYLQSYVNEYGFRYNHRKDEQPMFESFLGRIVSVR
jgi:transposase-like protein